MWSDFVVTRVRVYTVFSGIKGRLGIPRGAFDASQTCGVGSDGMRTHRLQKQFQSLIKDPKLGELRRVACAILLLAYPKAWHGLQDRKVAFLMHDYT